MYLCSSSILSFESVRNTCFTVFTEYFYLAEPLYSSIILYSKTKPKMSVETIKSAMLDNIINKKVRYKLDYHKLLLISFIHIRPLTL